VRTLGRDFTSVLKFALKRAFSYFSFLIKLILKTGAEFLLCVRHDCLGIHLHRIGIRPDPYCMLCSLHETMDRNHLGRCNALSSGTECERYWEARTKMMEN